MAIHCEIQKKFKPCDFTEQQADYFFACLVSFYDTSRSEKAALVQALKNNIKCIIMGQQKLYNNRFNLEDYKMNNKIKVLIGDDTPDNGLTLAGLLKNEGMFAVTRQKNGRVILDSIKADVPDFLIIDAKMPEMDAAELISQIRDFTPHPPMIIVTSNYSTPQLEKEVMDAGASYFMVKPVDPSVIVKKIMSLYNFKSGNVLSAIKNELVNIEYIVTDVIHQIGIPAHIKGYHYLRTAIILSVNDEEMINRVTKLLYPTVAKRYNTTSSRVERAIRHAIEIAWDRGDVDVLNGIFGYTVHSLKGKPTNSEFVALIADRLRLQYFPHIEV